MKIKGVRVEASKLAQMYMEGKTLQEIGDIYGVTRERIRQILSSAGFNVRDCKSYYKLQERKKCLNIADNVLLKTANNSIKDVTDKLQSIQMKHKALKQYRIKIIREFQNTLFNMREILYLAETGKQPPSVIFEQLNKKISEELENLKKYRNLIED